MAIGLPSFKESGDMNPKRFVNELERYLVKKIEDEYKVIVFIQAVDGEVRHWLENIG